jgi:hypothetical protein
MIAEKNSEMFPKPNGGVNNSDKPKQKRPRISAKQRAEKAKSISDEAVKIVWDYWVKTMGASKLAVLDHDRKVKIAASIHDYGIEASCLAIDGCASSPFHMGDNPQQKKYNGIDLIFRDADKIEGFIQRTEKRNARQEFLDE